MSEDSFYSGGHGYPIQHSLSGAMRLQKDELSHSPEEYYGVLIRRVYRMISCDPASEVQR